MWIIIYLVIGVIAATFSIVKEANKPNNLVCLKNPEYRALIGFVLFCVWLITIILWGPFIIWWIINRWFFPKENYINLEK